VKVVVAFLNKKPYEQEHRVAPGQCFAQAFASGQVELQLVRCLGRLAGGAGHAPWPSASARPWATRR